MLEYVRTAENPKNASVMEMAVGLADIGDLQIAKSMLNSIISDRSARSMLGTILLDGEQSDRATGFELLSEAADEGDPDAMRNLGYCYAVGVATAIDKERAAMWYLRAAELGDAHAQCNIGVLFRGGSGVDQDLRMAAYWFEKSAEQGYPRAMTNLGEMFCEGKAVTKDYAMAMKLFSRSRSPRALYRLALMFRDGLGVAADYDAYHRCIVESAEKGYPKACTVLAKESLPSDKEKAIRYLCVAASKYDAEASSILSSLGVNP